MGSLDILKWIKDWATPLSAGATLVAVIVALGVGVASIFQTKNIQKRERKERLINEIIDWLYEIHNSSLDPNIDFRNPNFITNAQTLLRYGKAFSQTEYFGRLIKISYPELSTHFMSLRESFVSFLYLKQIEIGANNPEDSFVGDEYLKIIGETKNKLSDKNSNLQEILNQQTINLSNNINELLIRLATIKAKLI
ncbi:MAG: hypothetical protein ABR886_10045 [Dehalococcoidales bacterium]|jgi:hypothetical protein